MKKQKVPRCECGEVMLDGGSMGFWCPKGIQCTGTIWRRVPEPPKAPGVESTRCGWEDYACHNQNLTGGPYCQLHEFWHEFRREQRIATAWRDLERWVKSLENENFVLVSELRERMQL